MTYPNHAELCRTCHIHQTCKDVDITRVDKFKEKMFLSPHTQIYENHKHDVALYCARQWFHDRIEIK